MSPEQLAPETKKLRNGETTSKPYGGKISSDPFPQALYGLARNRGFESQLSLGRALGQNSNQRVGDWYHGEHLPHPVQLGNIFTILEPDPQELDHIVELYAEALSQRKRGRHPFPKESKNPFRQWLINFCINKKAPLEELKFELQIYLKNGNNPGLEPFSQLLQYALQTLNLTEEETESLGEAVAQTIARQIQEGHRFQQHDLRGKKLEAIQATLPYKTYTPAQTARELGISRERVRQRREELDLPLLLTASDLAKIREQMTLTNTK